MAQAIPIGLAIAGTALSAGGTIIGAKGEAKALRSEARQLDAKAGTERATSQRAAAEETRQARLLQSRALALAAASGGAADDPTVVNLIADLEGEAEYRALTALYRGEEEARGLEMAARSRRREAKNVKRAGMLNAAGTVLQAGSSIYEKYG